MTLEETLNILAFLALLAAGVIPLVIATRVKVASLRTLSLLLGLFAIITGSTIS